ncbi:MAG: glucose 1-dehydrogenase [Chloroflexi bacterium]|nr:glucose 1-dehydrogenase [Chloroflexota bacterium]
MNVMELFRLDGKVAIVTGGSRGLGFWMAEGLAEVGANVVLCARKLEPCEEAAKAIRDIGVRSLAVGCDVTDPDAVKALIERTISEFGRVDILINNAGFIWEEPPEKVSLETWNKTLAINATGTFLCSQEAGKHMIKQRQGKIINIASISGLASVDPELSNTVPYSAAKGAIVALTRDLARKWCQYNITVNAIAPGYFATKMSKYLAEHRQPQLMNSIRMKRLGTKDEIKGVAVFLASAASNYITGQIFAVDGGTVM